MSIFRAILPGLMLMLATLSMSMAGDKGKEWALYTWLDTDGRWNYSLVRGTDEHPDGDQVRTAATQNLEAIKTRIALLERGSSVQINPLPVLNMEMHLPSASTVREFERVCNAAQLHLLR